MAEYDNELTGVLFRNEHMREGKQDADRAGSRVIVLDLD